MKRLLLTLLVLLSLEIYIPQVVQAQSYEEVEGIMKGYCSRIDVQDGSFDTDQFVKISPVTTESGVDSVLIKGVTVTDTKTGSSQSFDIGKTFTSSQLAGGVAFQVPSLTFMQSESKSTSGRDQFTMNFDKIVTFQNPDFDVSKPTKQTATVNCKDSAAMNLSPSAQAGGTSQSSSTTNTTAANPAGPKVTGSGKELNVFCDEAKTKINTAIGCIPITATEDTIGWLLGWAIGISGGIALVLIAVAGFNIMTAAGDPQKLNGGRELLTAAVSGLVLIIFSVFILRLIGVQILQIPGLF